MLAGSCRLQRVIWLSHYCLAIVSLFFNALTWTVHSSRSEAEPNQGDQDPGAAVGAHFLNLCGLSARAASAPG
jgi:hypothetical protein